jgi:hypothetical protein
LFAKRKKIFVSKREVALLGVDGAFRLAGHLGPEVLLRQGQQTRLGIPLRNRHNLMLKIIAGISASLGVIFPPFAWLSIT